MNILLHFRHFPVAMGRYLHWALEREGHTVFTVGSYWPDGKIPWGPQFEFKKYDMPPDFQTNEQETYPLSEVLSHIDFKLDIIIQAADTEWLEGKAPCPNIIVATDPHCIDYHPRLANADGFVCMQNCYLQSKYDGKGIFMPYGYDPMIHKRTNLGPRLWDVVFIGLQYPHRQETLQAIAEKGWQVFNTLGYIYEDYVQKYNEGSIAFNWSSQEDLPARFWEGMAMGNCLLTSRVPDMELFDFKEDVDYVGFSTKEEAVIKADYYLKHPSLMEEIANSGYLKVRKHTYDNRVREMLKKVLK